MAQLTDYQRDNLQALPASQRSLMTLVLRKLLASSTFAIAGALESLSRCLRARLQQAPESQSLEEELTGDFEALDAIAEEWNEEDTTPEPLSASERTALEQEITDLERFRELAVSITHNAKGVALLAALQTAFAKAEALGAARKALIFTESRRTQDYLLRVLADSPYKDGIVLFNGSNNDAKSRQLYAEWLDRHTGTDRVTGSRNADMRSALVDYFHE
jgi:adenine-specific DNA-methyltransferase